MKKETVKKPRQPRTTLLSVLADTRIESVCVLLRTIDNRLVYVVNLKQDFMLCNLFNEPSPDFAVLDLCEIPNWMAYVQEMPF